MVDTNRRSIPIRAVGRALSGQDRYEKEALEGDPASPFAAMRRERLEGALPSPKGKVNFADRLKQATGAPKKDPPR
jgi:hypothetical protein